MRFQRGVRVGLAVTATISVADTRLANIARGILQVGNDALTELRQSDGASLVVAHETSATPTS